MTKYSFCESVTASSSSPWHIRRLTDVGRKLGGDIDTGSLCGLVKAHYGWDLSADINTDGDHHLCRACVMAYAKLPVDEEK
jgi:hypothetical protein